MPKLKRRHTHRHTKTERRTAAAMTKKSRCAAHASSTMAPKAAASGPSALAAARKGARDSLFVGVDWCVTRIDACVGE